MEAIGVIGMIIAIVALIYLTFKGMNGFVASLAATVILIVTSGLPFWDTMVNTYAASMGKIFGSYLFMFCVASAYSELMKQSGAAESIANFFFSIFGVKASCAATVIISFLLAYSGINAFIIIFAIYPGCSTDVPQSKHFQESDAGDIPVWFCRAERCDTGLTIYAVYCFI